MSPTALTRPGRGATVRKTGETSCRSEACRPSSPPPCSLPRRRGAHAAPEGRKPDHSRRSRSPVRTADDHRHGFKGEVAEDPAHPDGRHIFLDGFGDPASSRSWSARAVGFEAPRPGERDTDDLEGPSRPRQGSCPTSTSSLSSSVVRWSRPPNRSRPMGHDPSRHRPSGGADRRMAARSYRVAVATLKGKAGPDAVQHGQLRHRLRSQTPGVGLRQDRSHRRVLRHAHGAGLYPQHPDHVRSTTLKCPVAPDAPMRAKAFARHAEIAASVIDLCMEAHRLRPSPTWLRDLVRGARATDRQGPITSDLEGRRTVTISPSVVAHLIRGALYGPNTCNWVPYAFASQRRQRRFCSQGGGVSRHRLPLRKGLYLLDRVR